MAIREASSVDDYENDKLSYIGVWGLIVRSLINEIDPKLHRKVNAWTESHNDELEGQAVGWEGAAEEGHAEDAKDAAAKFIKDLEPDAFANVINEVSYLHEQRLNYWDSIIENLESHAIEPRISTNVSTTALS